MRKAENEKEARAVLEQLKKSGINTFATMVITHEHPYLVAKLVELNDHDLDSVDDNDSLEIGRILARAAKENQAIMESFERIMQATIQHIIGTIDGAEIASIPIKE